jgi:hypothetical protein
MGNANKILTLVLNHVLWENHASVQVDPRSSAALPRRPAPPPTQAGLDERVRHPRTLFCTRACTPHTQAATRSLSRASSRAHILELEPRTRTHAHLQANMFLLLSLIGAGLYGEAKRRDAPPPTPPAASNDEEAPDSDSVPLIPLMPGQEVATKA